MSKSKSEIEKIIESIASFRVKEFTDKFYIIPKDSPPEKWVKIMVGEQEHHEVFRESVELKWRTQDGEK